MDNKDFKRMVQWWIDKEVNNFFGMSSYALYMDEIVECEILADFGVIHGASLRGDICPCLVEE